MAYAAIVLAAGASQRMGSPKALLEWSGGNLLSYALAQLRAAGVEHIVVVLGLAHQRIREVVPDVENTTVMLNLDEASGRSGSIRIGAAAVPDGVSRVLVQSVDQPCDAEVLTALLRANGDLTVPTYDGRRGHPICVSGALLPELQQVREETEGLRALTRRYHRTEVPVQDPAVTWNLNDPEAYAEALRSI